MAQILPPVKFRVTDISGFPLDGGKVYAFFPGTNNPKDTFTDATGSIMNDHPVILDARGEADIWLENNQPYKIVVRDSSEAIIYSVDNVIGVGGGGGGNVDLGTVFVSALDPVADFLSSKLTAGNNIALNIVSNPSGDNVQIEAILDGKVFASGSDTVSGFLFEKLISSDGSIIIEDSSSSVNLKLNSSLTSPTLRSIGENSINQSDSNYTTKSGIPVQFLRPDNSLLFSIYAGLAQNLGEMIFDGNIRSETIGAGGTFDVDFIKLIQSKQLNVKSANSLDVLVDIQDFNELNDSSTLRVGKNGGSSLVDYAVEIQSGNIFGSNPSTALHASYVGTGNGRAASFTADKGGADVVLEVTGGNLASIEADNGIKVGKGIGFVGSEDPNNLTENLSYIYESVLNRLSIKDKITGQSHIIPYQSEMPTIDLSSVGDASDTLVKSQYQVNSSFPVDFLNENSQLILRIENNKVTVQDNLTVENDLILTGINVFQLFEQFSNKDVNDGYIGIDSIGNASLSGNFSANNFSEGGVNLGDKYQQLSEKNQNNGYLGINADGSTDVNSSEFEILKLIRGSAGGAAIDFRNSSGRIGRAGFQSSGEFELLGDIKNSLLMRGPENEEGYFRLIEGSSFQGFGIHYLGNSTNQTDFFTHQINDNSPANDIVFMSVQRGSKNVEFRGEVSAETFKSQSFNTIPFTSSAGSQSIVLPAVPGAIYRLSARCDVTGDIEGQGGYSMDVVLSKTTNRTLGIMNESSSINGTPIIGFNNLNNNKSISQSNASSDAYRTVVVDWSSGFSGNIDINIMRVI